MSTKHNFTEKYVWQSRKSSQLKELKEWEARKTLTGWSNQFKYKEKENTGPDQVISEHSVRSFPRASA